MRNSKRDLTNSNHDLLALPALARVRDILLPSTPVLPSPLFPTFPILLLSLLSERRRRRQGRRRRMGREWVPHHLRDPSPLLCCTPILSPRDYFLSLLRRRGQARIVIQGWRRGPVRIVRQGVGEEEERGRKCLIRTRRICC